MRAATIAEFGGPEGVDVTETAEPKPEAGEVRLDVEACALNRHDLWILEGESFIGRGALPFVTGVDVAGIVEAVGEGVRSVEPGDRVLACPNVTCGTCEFCREGPENLCARFTLFHGGLAERATVDADRLIAIPEGVDAVEAAALPVAYMTAWHMLRRADAGPGDLILVPGATGGVGVATVQLADAIGARPVGTSTSREKLDRLEAAGAVGTIESGDPEEIESAMGRFDAPAVVVNHLGGAYTGMGLSVLKRGGVMTVCGRTAGGRSEIDLAGFFLAHKRIVGSTMGTQGDLETVLGLVSEGRFRPPIHGEYALDDTGEAFAAMQDRTAFGKVVVRPNE
jgi:NADPH2:quinone reductase